MTKNAMLTIAGRPNAGKSTLINRVVGEKIAIVSEKPQTTRNRITGVKIIGETQLIFMDTPGIHRARTKLGEYMVRVVKESIGGVDAVLMLVEPVPNVGHLESELIEQIRGANVPAVLAVNKIDAVEKNALLDVIKVYSDAFGFDAIVPISAKTGEGVGELLAELEKYAVEGSWLFPDGMVSDQPDRQLCAEIIREKLLLCLDKEIPHGTAVEITQFSERDSGVIDLGATIFCEKLSHKGIIIGKNGAMLKKIGELSRTEIENFMGTKVFLQTWVKVKENWRDSGALLRNFGYK